MQLSRRADYGVRVMLEVASTDGDAIVTVDALTRRQGIPRTFAGKIASQLAHAGLLRTSRGSHGGLTLARPAEEINLRQVIEALDGPIMLNLCLIRAGACPRDRFCAVHLIWREAQADLVRRLEEARLSVLVAQQRSIVERRPGTEAGTGKADQATQAAAGRSARGQGAPDAGARR